MSGLVIAMIGMLLIVCVTNPTPRLAGYYLTQASPTPFVALLSLISSNVAGYTKKTTVAALYLIAYCAGNIIGPQTFRPQDKPAYRPAEIIILVCWGACLVDLAFIYCEWVSAFPIYSHVFHLKDFIMIEEEMWFGDFEEMLADDFFVLRVLQAPEREEGDFQVKRGVFQA